MTLDEKVRRAISLLQRARRAHEDGALGECAEWLRDAVKQINLAEDFVDFETPRLPPLGATLN